MQNRSIVYSRQWAILALILVIAGVLRFDAIQYNHFREDESALARLAQQIVTTHKIPLLGIKSSAGAPNSPITEYILVPPYLVSSNSLFATAYIALWNVLGVGLLWLLVKRVVNTRAAHVAALLYAVAPWAIWFSSKIWAQDYHTPIILLAILLAWVGYMEGRLWAQVVSWPVMLIGIQIHFAAWTCLPLMFAFLWIGRKQVRVVAVIAGIALACLTLVPFVRGLAQPSQTGSSSIISTVAQIPAALIKPQVYPLGLNFQLATELGFPDYIYDLKQDGLIQQTPLIPLVALSLALLTLLGALAVWKQSKQIALLMFVWIVVPILVFVPNWVFVHIFYFVPTLPAYCLLQGAGFIWLNDWLKTHVRPQPLVKLSLALGLGMLCMSQLTWWRATLNYIDVNPSPSQGVPVHYLNQVRHAVENTKDILFDSEVTDGVLGFKVWAGFLFGTAACIRPAVAGSGVILPSHPFQVLHVSSVPHTALTDIFTVGKPTVLPFRPGEGDASLYSFDHTPEWTPVPLHDVIPAAFDNGATLTGYAIADGEVYLRWTIAHPVPEGYQVSVQMLDSDGNRLNQADSNFFPTQYLCDQDTLIIWRTLTPAPRAATLRVILYTVGTEGFQNSNVLDPKGNVVRPWLDIPLNTDTIHI